MINILAKSSFYQGLFKATHTHHLLYLHCNPTRWIVLLHSFFSEKIETERVKQLAQGSNTSEWWSASSNPGSLTTDLLPCLIIILSIMLWWPHDSKSLSSYNDYDPFYGTWLYVVQALADMDSTSFSTLKSSLFLFYTPTPARPASLWEWKGRACLGPHWLPPQQSLRLGRAPAEEEPQSSLTF